MIDFSTLGTCARRLPFLVNNLLTLPPLFNTTLASRGSPFVSQLPEQRATLVKSRSLFLFKCQTWGRFLKNPSRKTKICRVPPPGVTLPPVPSPQWVMGDAVEYDINLPVTASYLWGHLGELIWCCHRDPPGQLIYFYLVDNADHTTHWFSVSNWLLRSLKSNLWLASCYCISHQSINFTYEHHFQIHLFPPLYFPLTNPPPVSHILLYSIVCLFYQLLWMLFLSSIPMNKVSLNK